MSRRVTAALVLGWLLLVGGTVVIGLHLDDRLGEAAAVLDRALAAEVPVDPSEPLDLGGPGCSPDQLAEVAAAIRSFDAVVAVARAEAADDIDVRPTPATFETLRLDRALARRTLGRDRLTVHAALENGRWCLAAAEHTTEPEPARG